MALVSTPTNEQTTGSYDPNSIVDYLAKSGQANTLADRGKLYASTFGSGGGAYTGSAAQNMALLTKVKGGYTGTTNPKTISGSGAVSQNKKTSQALNSAAGSLTQPATQQSAAASSTVPPVTQPVTNPIIAGYQQQTQTAIDQAHQDSQVSLKPITDAFSENMTQLQLQKTQAISAAEVSYARANPYGSGSDKDEFLSSISQGFNTQIQNAQSAYADQAAISAQSLQDNINTINTAYQQNVAAYHEQQQTNLQWSLVNNPPAPLDLNGVKNPQEASQALMSWATQHQDLISTAFNTGNYGDPNNMQDVMAAAYQLSQPTKAYIEEQALVSRAGSAAVSAGAAASNAATNSDYKTFMEGLATTPETTTASKVSGASKIPLVGGLFGSTTTTVKQKGSSSDNSYNGFSLPN